MKRILLTVVLALPVMAQRTPLNRALADALYCRVANNCTVNNLTIAGTCTGCLTGAPPLDATYITQTANATLTNEQALSALTTGYVKVTTGTGILSAQAAPIPVADGGTNAATAADARTSLGLAIGTNVQAFDADLTTYAGITPSANVQTLLGAADFAAFRTSLSLVPGTNVQTWDADLDTLAGKTIPSGATLADTSSAQTLTSKTITDPTLDGNLTFSGLGKFIVGDFDNATLANRLYFKTSTTNGTTAVGAVPNGTGTASSFQVFGLSDTANSHFLNIGSNATEAFINSNKTGTGVAKPLALKTAGVTGLQLDSTNPHPSFPVSDKCSTANFDSTSATLATVTGLSVTVTAAKKYQFEAVLHVTTDATGGHKYAIAGTATATSVIYQINSINNATNAFRINARHTSLGGSTGEAVGTAYFTRIEGYIVVNAAGTLLVQFAQNAATGTSSVLAGSCLTVREIQ